MVVAYVTRKFESSIKGSTIWAASVEQARSFLPPSAVRLVVEPQHQFLELWEVPPDSELPDSK